MLKRIILIATLIFCIYLVQAQEAIDSTRRNLYFSIVRERDFEKKEQLFKQFERLYLQQEDSFSSREKQALYATMAAAYQDVDSVRQYDYYASKIGAEKFAFSYFNFAKKLVAAKKHPVYAKAFAKAALEGFEKDRLNKPAPPGVDSGYKARMDYAYAGYLDMYAYACYINGDYKEGYPYAKKAAVAIFKDTSWTYNEHYALLLAKAQPPAVAKKELERLVKTGMLNEKGKAALKEVFISLNKNEKGYSAYLEKLESSAKSKAESALRKRMVNMKAADFTLVNLQGDTVSLSALKGKTVVLDFWATWCVPCVRAFPAMQKTIDRFKNNKDVVFLFIDTKETGEDKPGKVKAFMSKGEYKDYDFTILLDNDNKVQAAYGVIGIPAKFVIDPAGNIRFTTTGYNGKEDELIEEMTLMIKMASNSK